MTRSSDIPEKRMTRSAGTGGPVYKETSRFIGPISACAQKYSIYFDDGGASHVRKPAVPESSCRFLLAHRTSTFIECPVNPPWS